jgi:predicted anti-sigma-YlaC factor YlaD
MKSNCDKMKGRIADFITGILPEEETQTFQQHLSECSQCRDYAKRLQEEEQLLTGFFAKFDENMTYLEDEAINAINRFDTPSQTTVISVGKKIVKNLLIKRAAVAAVIVFVALYFIITYTWISDINECILLSM